MAGVVSAGPDEPFPGATGDRPACGGRRHRRILCAALTTAGLTNYPAEWGHCSHGNRYRALRTGATAARYGPSEAWARPWLSCGYSETVGESAVTWNNALFGDRGA